MGARTTFVQAMVMGAVVGAALTTAFFQLRRDDRGERTVAAKPAAVSDAPAPSDAAARAREIAVLRARIAELERANATAGSAANVEPDMDGPRIDDDWWARLPPNPAWDEPRERKVIDRLARLGVQLADGDIECRTRCCRFVLDPEQADLDELQSSVGLFFEPRTGFAIGAAGEAMRLVTCWAPAAPDTPYPDRLAEREALLAKVARELERCGARTTAPITLRLRLGIDPQGQIASVDSNAKDLGHPAATCAESALLQGANFAPAPRPTEVPVRVILGKS